MAACYTCSACTILPSTINAYSTYIYLCHLPPRRQSRIPPPPPPVGRRSCGGPVQEKIQSSQPWACGRSQLLHLSCVCVCVGEDAKQAVSHGVDGILVSNHGGRQLDGVTATVRPVVFQYSISMAGDEFQFFFQAIVHVHDSPILVLVGG